MLNVTIPMAFDRPLHVIDTPMGELQMMEGKTPSVQEPKGEPN